MSRGIISLVVLASGAILQGMAMALFLFPYDIASGGAAGIAILLETGFSLPHAITIFGLNLSLLIVAVRWIGFMSSFKTVYTVSISSLTIWFFQSLQVENPIPIYLSMMIGAVLFGLGIGILFRNGASSGGLAIVAHILYVVVGILPGKTLFWMNMVVFTVVAYTIDWRLLLFAFVTQWVATKVLNQIVLYKLPKGVKENTAQSA